MKEKTIVCLLWGNGIYSPEWVHRLYRGVARNMSSPFNFVCFSDTPESFAAPIDSRDIHKLSLIPDLTGIWWKLSVLHPVADLHGDCLFLDLDTVITDSIEPFFDYPGQFCMIQNWIEWHKQIFRARPLIGNSSVVRFIGGQEKQVAEAFIADPTQAMDRNFYRTEQVFMTEKVGLDNMIWWPDEWVRSYKRQCLPNFPLNWIRPPKIPADARILAFHGEPKPLEVINGVKNGLRKTSLPMPELKKYWD